MTVFMTFKVINQDRKFNVNFSDFLFEQKIENNRNQLEEMNAEVFRNK